MFRTLFAAAALLAAPATAAPLTVVELFQSQGCSSCPPANANVNALIAARPDVLALSWAVTYWDQLGWQDRFAQPAFTSRQRDYQAGLGTDNVWTPQVVVNGRAHIVGNKAGPLGALVANTPRAPGPAVALTPAKVSIAAATAPRAAADVWLVRYDPRTQEVAVRAGENGGRTLPHRNIVRQLTRLGTWSGAAQSFALPPAPAGLATAVLVQAPRGGAILAAAKG